MAPSPNRRITSMVMPVVLLMLAAALPATGQSLHRYSDAPTKDWRKGPVRYIITRSEDKEFKQLDTEDLRRKAIEAFWLRRDPTPKTPGNEFRSRFWRRVRDATRLYGRDTPRPGWLTDMGKIHILFGPPDEISRDEMAEGRRGIIVWMYRNTPQIGEDRVLVGPNQVIAFAQDSSNEYRLTSEPSKMANVWEGLPNPQPIAGLNKYFKIQQRLAVNEMTRALNLTDPVISGHGGPATGTPLGMSMVLARIQQPPKAWELRAEITTREFFGTLPFRARAEFFKTASDKVHVVFNVATKSRSVTYRSTPSGDRPSVEVFARILDSTGVSLVASLEGQWDFEGAPGNSQVSLDDDLIFQGSAYLPPGAYIARLTVHDDVSGRTATTDTPFSVPDFSGQALGLSSVSLARSLETREGVGDAVVPYRFGNIQVIPRLGHDYFPSGEVAFYYQIYGAGRDPESGKPALDVTYSFLALEGEETVELGAVGFVNQEAESHGYALPLEGWPSGNYLIRINIADRVSKTETSREVAFRIIDEP
jgi:GWxTD domain-containing protein